MYNYTFIIPHKNSPELLRRCIDSIPQRDDVQVIVVDDNSDDGLKPTLTRENLVIKYLNASGAKRAGHARNTGMRLAEGKWLMFADADDYYCADLLAVLDKYKDTDFDVVYFNYCVGTTESTFKGYSLIDKYEGGQENLDAIKYKTNAPWNKMVRRAFVEEKNIEFEETVNGNDMFFTYQIGYFAKQINVDKSIIYYYDTSTNGMTNNKRNSEEYYLCRLNHWYQTNAFYTLINHNEWQSFLLKRFAAVFVKKGLGQFLLCLKVFLSRYFEIRGNRMKFVNQILEKENGTESEAT